MFKAATFQNTSDCLFLNFISPKVVIRLDKELSGYKRIWTQVTQGDKMLSHLLCQKDKNGHVLFQGILVSQKCFKVFRVFFYAIWYVQGEFYYIHLVDPKD